MILESHLRISECTIPGPLVPFFQALAAINGPFVCMGDIVLFMMELPSIWSLTGFHPTANVARQLPIPAIILDSFMPSRASPMTIPPLLLTPLSIGIGTSLDSTSIPLLLLDVLSLTPGPATGFIPLLKLSNHSRLRGSRHAMRYLQRCQSSSLTHIMSLRKGLNNLRR